MKTRMKAWLSTSNDKLDDDNDGPLPENAWTSGNTDAEKNSTAPLQRRLQPRHLQMLAIGGTVGTGLVCEILTAGHWTRMYMLSVLIVIFIGSGGALATAGPAGALIAYTFVGSLVFSVMISIGEMATYIPVSGAFTTYASRFVDRSLGFSLGWIYWFNWAIVFALELTASGLIIQYWAPDLNIGILVAVFFVVITALNLMPVSVYGEIEFWLSSVKVVTILGFLIFGICINAGAGQHGYLGFKTWKEPGAFAPFLTETNETLAENIPLARFVGLWAVMIQAGFSYQGTELVGIAAGETADPHKSVPKAIRQTFWRILFFFVLTIFFIGILVPYDNPQLLNGSTDAASSPLVIAANLAGVPVLPDIINGVLFTVVLSAANSCVFSGSRVLVGLANDGFAPKIFKEASKKGVPYSAVAFTSIFGLLGLLNVSSGSGVVFNWLLNIAGVAGFIAWACIGISHIAFMRALEAQGISRDGLPYKAVLQPYLTWYGIGFNVIIVITQGFQAFMPWSVSDFFAAYISLILFIALYAGHKCWTRCSFVKPADANLDTGMEEAVELDAHGVKPKS